MSTTNVETSKWTVEEKKKLLNAVVEMGGSNNTKSYKTVESSLKWENIQVDGKSAEECKAMYQKLIGKVRRYRTMQEIIADALVHVDDPGKLAFEYPDMPKKPPTVFSLFVMKRSKKFPDVKGTKRMTVFANDWNELSDAKKEKFKKKYLKLKRKYEEELEIFRQNHPDCPLPGTNSTSRPNPPLPSKLFIESRIEKAKSKHPELSNAEIVKILMNKYKELSDKKKLKWIKRAMRCRQTYQDQVDVYLAHNPKPTMKPAVLHLSKEEERIWHSSRGKPVPAPPKNLFSYFCNTKRDTLLHLGISEQSRELASLYHKLTEEEVSDLTKAFKKEVEEYVQAYNHYYNSLPEEEKSEEKAPEEALAAYHKILQDDQRKKKKKKSKNIAAVSDEVIDKKVKLSDLLPRPNADYESDSDVSLPSVTMFSPLKRKAEPHVDPVTPQKKHKNDTIAQNSIAPAQNAVLDEDALLSLWSPKSYDTKPPAEDIEDTPTKAKSPKKRSKKSKA
ncbi:hypothetical protein BsWGS_14185 [Bradybaena similaris]